MNTLRSILAVTFFTAAALLVTGASAATAVIVTPDLVTASSTFATPPSAKTPAVRTINLAGLDSAYVSGVSGFDTYDPASVLQAPEATFEWFSALGTTTATLLFEFTVPQKLDRVAVWQEESVGFGTAAFAVSLDGVSYSPVATLDGAATGFAFSYPATVVPFSTTAAARFVLMSMSGCSDQCAVGEVAFSSVGAVPLPAAAPLLLGGFGLLGAFVRRRCDRDGSRRESR